MKNTVDKILGLQKVSGDVGLEIEVQGLNLPRENSKWWKVTLDGSLRGQGEGLEYVSPKPISEDMIDTALSSLKKNMLRCKTEYFDSIYAGVHVHINCQHLSPKQVFTFLTAYFILEEVLTDYCGPTRVGNHFCLRGKDAEGFVNILEQACSNGNLSDLNTGRYRYGAVNPTSLFKYGSLEFRAMRSTSDFGVISNWAKLLLKLRDNSLLLTSPIHAVEQISMDGELNFLRNMLGEYAELFPQTPATIKKIREGTRLIQTVAFHPDWSRWKDESEPNNNPFTPEVPFYV